MESKVDVSPSIPLNSTTERSEEPSEDHKKVEEEDIIIKCGLEEMVKEFFKEYVIVWHDPNVNSQENQEYLAQLKKFCVVKTFTKWQEASTYILQEKEACHVITSGTDGELLMKEIESSQSVTETYIFCRDEDYHSTWIKSYQKISCIKTQIQDVINQIQDNLLKWYKNASSLKLNLPAYAPIFDDYDKSQMNNLHRYLQIIPNFNNRSQAQNDFLELSRKIYSSDRYFKHIAEFENDYQEYNKEKILNWYTRPSFLYRIVNNCLRVATSDSIQYCRLLLKDIENAIREHYQDKSHSFHGLLYRGAYLSEQEWLVLKGNTGREIEMHGFLSVSKDQNIALNFMDGDSNKKVLITILVPKGPNEEVQGFAEVEEFSKVPKEKEVLFNVRSRFTILETENEYSEELPYRHLVLLYGAQGFRKFVAEKNPIREISIVKNISCNICQDRIQEMAEKMFFIPLTEEIETQACICYKCLDTYFKADNTPLFCVPLKESIEGKHSNKIQGFRLTYSIKENLKLPLYGYQCKKCQLKKHKCYFQCIECSNGKEKWCASCFEQESTCIESGHSVILESMPFSFWCEKMSKNELNHLEFQKELFITRDQRFQQAEMYSKSQQYQKAIDCYHIYIQRNENKQDADLASSYNNIARAYGNQGEYKKTLEYCFKSLEIRKAVDRDNNLATATLYKNIGFGYNQQGEYEKALGYCFKSLEIRKSVYGDNHRTTANSYKNIGYVYDKQGEDEKALEHYSKCLQIQKSIYGDNHPETAISYKNIGFISHKQGVYNKALEYSSKCLEIEKSVYGDNHSATATSFHNIGSIYRKQGEDNKALEYYFKSLEIRKSVYGDNHLATVPSYKNIGLIYCKQGEYNKALEHYSKSLEIKKSIYGNNHPKTAISYSNIGCIYRKQRKYNKAREYYLKCLEIQISIYGDNHPKTAVSYNSMGVVYHGQGEYNKALEHYSKSLEIKESIYGDNHPKTAVSYSNIGCNYCKQKQYNKARECYLKCLEIKKSVYGDNHPETAKSYNKIGCIYRKQRKYNKAREYYLKCLEIQISVYGDNHSKTTCLKAHLQKISDLIANLSLRGSRSLTCQNFESEEKRP